MELIYYVDEHDVPTGETSEKLIAHNANTKLHAAFSCYIVNDKGELLITQRSHEKKVWPGVWTNSCCGHPAPGESRVDALKRRVRYELGMEVAEINVLTPHYRYTTPPFNGIIENEYCPIYLATTQSNVIPNMDEVAAYEWVSFSDVEGLLKSIENDTTKSWSWWFIDQLKTISNNEGATSLLQRYTGR